MVLIGIAQEKTPVWRSWKAKGQERASHPDLFSSGIRVRGQLLLIIDDVNGGLLGGGSASVDTDVISHQVGVYVFAKPLVRRDKSTCSRASHLISLRKFGLPLGFVGSLLLLLVERVI